MDNPRSRSNIISEVGPAAVSSGKPSNVNLDSRYAELTDLPSKFAFYQSLHSIAIRRFNLMDIRKLHHAVVTNDIREFVQTINNTLGNFSAFDLTVGDFWYLCYWHKINSYTKTPFIMESVCKNIKKHKSEKPVVEVLQITDTKLIEKKLENQEELHAFILKQIDETGISFAPVRMIDEIEIQEDIEKLKDETENKAALARSTSGEEPDPAIAEKIGLETVKKAREIATKQWWLDLAAHLHPSHGISLKDRVKWLDSHAEKLDDGFLASYREFDALSDHGVKEFVTLKCKECENKVEQEVSTDIGTFLPEL